MIHLVSLPIHNSSQLASPPALFTRWAKEGKRATYAKTRGDRSGRDLMSN
jgi:hypothetical protein